MLMTYQVILEKTQSRIVTEITLTVPKIQIPWILGKFTFELEVFPLELVLYFSNLSYKNIILDEIQT